MADRFKRAPHMIALALVVTSHVRVAEFETYDVEPNSAFALTGQDKHVHERGCEDRASGAR